MGFSGYQVLGTRYQVYTRYLVPGAWYLYRAPGTGCWQLYVMLRFRPGDLPHQEKRNKAEAAADTAAAVVVAPAPDPFQRPYLECWY